MATWKNLDTLDSFGKLKELKNHVDIAAALSGEEGGKRVADYSTPMAAGLSYNYAAKEVDETVLSALAKLADEAQLIDKFQELYNGAVINTGENRMVLHHLARKQLGNPVVVDGVDKREFYVAQQKKKLLILQIRFMLVRSPTKLVRNSPQSFRLVSAEVTLVPVLFTSHWRTGRRPITHSRWKRSSSATLTRMMQLQYLLL